MCHSCVSARESAMKKRRDAFFLSKTSTNRQTICFYISIFVSLQFSSRYQLQVKRIVIMIMVRHSSSSSYLNDLDEYFIPHLFKNKNGRKSPMDVDICFRSVVFFDHPSTGRKTCGNASIQGSIVFVFICSNLFCYGINETLFLCEGLYRKRSSR